MKTAVEWFAEQEEKLTLEFISKKISELEYGLYSLELLNKAKEMFEEQIIDAYRINPNNENWSNSGIDYYKETFKSE